MDRLSLVSKVNDSRNISNYRLISITLVLSKVYEWLILDQILDHIESQRIFAEQKSCNYVTES